MKQKHLPPFFHKTTRTWFENILGEPTIVQQEAWPVIEEGKHTLVSAPTGTGKTLTAFLVFIDRFMAQARAGTLTNELQLIYVSPLKALAADIRDNLKRPLDGIYHEELQERCEIKGQSPMLQQIHVAIRTGDTTQSERQYMCKNPPHILITTPESLYLLLTSKSGKKMLSSAKYIILDELHAVIESKRGAHLMLSLARLDFLCEKPLQRIGLSATIEPLEVAAKYLSPDSVTIIAPKMEKKVELKVTTPKPNVFDEYKHSVWKDIAVTIYDESLIVRSVITFVEGRKFAEQLCYYINEIGGEDYARVHHGSLSKERRHQVEQDLKHGNLKLLIATSSMELGIDVGEIDKVIQVGNPRTISSTMQRLGRAGHRPNETSVMEIFPRTAEEGLFCGLTAEVVRQGGVEHSKPPRLCLDVLAQHLVSMAAQSMYEVCEVMPILQRAYPFLEVTIEDVRDVLCMLAGDYEHDENIPVRPRILYDRIHDTVEGDPYSRMLAISAGGTIPDRGMFAVKNEAGVKIGEVEEEFVFESRVGDRFMLGSFSWKIQKITKDTVFVIPADSYSARTPFWKGDIQGRKLQTGYSFGKIFRDLYAAYETNTLEQAVSNLGLDELSSSNACDYIKRQIESTELLPSDQMMIIEHYKDETGNYQMMIHSLFGNQVNAPLALLLHECARSVTGRTINYVQDDDGILLFPYDGKRLPTGLLEQISPDSAKDILNALVPETPTFHIVFRYNAGRALMMGAKKFSRQPLWVQRVRGAQMLDSVVRFEDHPIIRETKRECLEDYWDLPGLISVLKKIQSKEIQIREIYQEIPSPMSFLLRKKTEESLMYNYAPTTSGIVHATESRLKEVKELLAPGARELEQLKVRAKLPENEKQLHSLLMIEGDIISGELKIPYEWLEILEKNEQVAYIEPGLWIALEQKELYEAAFVQQESESLEKILLRLLRYRGGQSMDQIEQRYCMNHEDVFRILSKLIENDIVVKSGEFYYHKEMYDRARTNMLMDRRASIRTQSSSRYAALLLEDLLYLGTPMEQLEHAISKLIHTPFSAELLESVLLPTRVSGYRGELLDQLMAQGDYFWVMSTDGQIRLERYDEIDWEAELYVSDENLSEREHVICKVLKQRGASFMNTLTKVVDGEAPYEELLSLSTKGIVCADSFLPVRYWQNKEKIQKAAIRQQVNAKVKLLSAGRWDFIRPLIHKTLEEQIMEAFARVIILSRETAQGLVVWSEALEILRVWEYTGKVRRGYFIEGLSGVQYILDTEFEKTMHSLEHPSCECIWLNAMDPAQPWGKRFPHVEGRAFINVVGTFVAMIGGEVVAVMERKGKIFRYFSEAPLDEAKLEVILMSFVKGVQRRSIYSSEKRITVKEYPPEAAQVLHKVGFHKEMLDYVLYRL